VETSSELLSHTAEVKLRVRAPSFGELVAEAGRSLGVLELGHQPEFAPGPWRQFDIQASDREALLVEWLNELIYRAETERWIPVDVEVRTATDQSLDIRARGIVAEETPARVKAATFHGLEITPVGDGFQAEVVFDV